MRNWSSIDYANCSCVTFVELVALKLDFRRVDCDEGVAGGFLKLIWVGGDLHFDVRLVASLFSFLRSKVEGRKVALRVLPGLTISSVMLL